MENFFRKVICVDKEDKIIGSALAGRVHNIKYLERHRAFSLFLFDSENRLLIQKRCSKKLVYPGFWSNTVCSHPFINPLSFSDPLRDVKNHIIKRTAYELGIKNLSFEDLQFVTRLHYKATDDKIEGFLLDGNPSPQIYFENDCISLDSLNNSNWGEFEIDYIFICKKIVDVIINPEEVEKYLYLTKTQYEQFIKEKKMSPWASLVYSFVDIFELANNIKSITLHDAKTVKKNQHRKKTN